MQTAYRFLSPHRPRLLPLLALLGALLPAARAAADTNLNSEMAELAKNVKQFLDGKRETAIIVGEFSGPIGFATSSGPAIASALSDELKKTGVDVKVSGTTYAILGKYHLVEDANSSDHLHAVAIESRIVVVKTEQEVVGLDSLLKPRGVYGDAAKASLLGLSVAISPTGDDKARDREVEQAYENPPKPSFDNTRIKAGDSPYSVEILVKQGDQYVPRAAKDVDGRAFVELNKDEVYRVRVYNDSDYEGTAALSIDGLSMFQFSELRNPKHKDKPLYDRLLVAAHGSYDIPGWHRNNDKNGSNQFLVTKYADSEAAQLYPNSANIGTITVTFAACWPKNGTPPPDEPKDPSPFSRSVDLGTKRGAVDGNGYHEVERQFGVVRSAVSVRYSKK